MAPDVLPPREQIVENQSGPDGDPSARAVLVNGQQNLHRPHELGSVFEEPGPVAEGFADKAELEVLQVPEPSMDHLGGPGGRLLAAPPFFEEGDAVSAASKLPRDAGAVDSSPDDGDICIQEYIPSNSWQSGCKGPAVVRALHMRQENQPR